MADLQKLWIPTGSRISPRRGHSDMRHGEHFAGIFSQARPYLDTGGEGRSYLKFPREGGQDG